MKKVFPFFLLGCAVAHAAALQLVPDQNARYPLKTVLTSAMIERYTTDLESRTPSQILQKMRAELEPLAVKGDALAQYYLALTYNKLVNSKNRCKDDNENQAYKWYQAAIKQKLGAAAVELAFRLKNGLCPRVATLTAATYPQIYRNLLDQAAEYGGKQSAVLALSLLSNYANPQNNTDKLPNIAKSTNVMMTYLERANTIDPNNTSIIDFYGRTLLEQKSFKKALVVFKPSNDVLHLNIVADLYANGVSGVQPDVKKAVVAYKKAAEGYPEMQEVLPLESHGKFGLYRLLCQKKIKVADVIPYYDKPDYQNYLENLNPKTCQPNYGAPLF